MNIDNSQCAVLSTLLKAFQKNMKKVDCLAASFDEMEKQKTKLYLTSKDICLIPRAPVY